MSERSVVTLVSVRDEQSEQSKSSEAFRSGVSAANYAREDERRLRLGERSEPPFRVGESG